MEPTAKGYEGREVDRFVFVLTAKDTKGAPPSSATPTVSDFELVISAAAGRTEITCVRGCTLTWTPVAVPASGPVEIHVPQAAVSGTINASGCVAPYWQSQSCRIWGWAKR